jgi:hypothetical protein
MLLLLATIDAAITAHPIGCSGCQLFCRISGGAGSLLDQCRPFDYRPRGSRGAGHFARVSAEALAVSEGSCAAAIKHQVWAGPALPPRIRPGRL